MSEQELDFFGLGDNSGEGAKQREARMRENVERAERVQRDLDRLKEELCESRARKKRRAEKRRSRVFLFFFICLLTCISVIIGLLVEAYWNPLGDVLTPPPVSRESTPTFQEEAGQLEERQKQFLRQQEKLLEAIEARKKSESKKGGK